MRELAGLVAEITGRELKPEIGPRRAGDAAKAVASCERMSGELGWTARRGVREMVGSAWQGWLLHHPVTSAP